MQKKPVTRMHPEIMLVTSKEPQIIFSRDAWEDIQIIIGLNPATEVAFHGEVTLGTNGSYHIEQIYVFRQFVSSIHVELALDGQGTMSEYIEKLSNGIEIDGYERELNIDKVFTYPPQFYFHGHLHPGTLLEHSSIDVDGYLGINEQLPYYIDAIFTRDGKFQFWFYGLGGYIKIFNCPIKILRDAKLNTQERNNRNDLIAEMITDRVIRTNTHGGHNGKSF